MTKFDRLQELTRNLERVILDLVTATTPWLAPLIPAYMAGHNMLAILGFPLPLAIIGAAVVEFLGLAAIHTTFQLWQWNETGSGTFRAPTVVAGLVGVFYLALVITVNVILEAGQVAAVEIAAKALLSLISVAAGVVLALRSQHARRLAEIQQRATDQQMRVDAELVRAADRQRELDAQAAQERIRALELRHKERMERMRLKSTTLPRQVAGTLRNVPERAESSRYPADWRSLSPAQKVELAGMTTQQIAQAAGLSDRAARGWKARLSTNGFHTDALTE